MFNKLIKMTFLGHPKKRNIMMIKQIQIRSETKTLQISFISFNTDRLKVCKLLTLLLMMSSTVHKVYYLKVLTLDPILRIIIDCVRMILPKIISRYKLLLLYWDLNNSKLFKEDPRKFLYFQYLKKILLI